MHKHELAKTGVANQPGDIVCNLFRIFIDRAKRVFSKVAKRLNNRTVRVIHSEIMMVLAIKVLVQRTKASLYCKDLKEEFGNGARLTIKPEYMSIAEKALHQYQLNKIVARAYQKF